MESAEKQMRHKNVPDVKIEEIGIYINFDKQTSVAMARRCVAYLGDRGVKTVMLQRQLTELGELAGVAGVPKDTFFSRPDCIVTLGGDGTLLGVARQVGAYETPICGINLGKLGFLTEGDAESCEAILARLCEGDYQLDQRMLLESQVTREDGTVEKQSALNDVVIKAAGIRMIDLTVAVDGELVDTFYADGLIVATPTGSTAYSLSAGGPVADPRANIMLINPICPHRLHDRAYVLPGRAVVDIRFSGRNHGIDVCADGQVSLSINRRGRVRITRAPYKTNLILFGNMSFFKQLRRKLTDH